MFRLSRRSGPPPFQVMSNTWRGPRQDTAKAIDRGRLADPVPPAAAPAPAAAPIAVAAPIAPAKAIDEPARPVKAAPKATIEVRRRNDPPTQPQAASLYLALAKKKAAAAVTWLGAVTIRGGSLVAQQWERIARRKGKRPGSGNGGAIALPRRTVVVGFSVFAALMLLIFWFNRGNDPAALTNTDNGGVKDANITALFPVEPTPGTPASPGTTSRQTPGTPGTAANSRLGPGAAITPPPAGVAPGQPRPKLARLAVDPREKGQRYFILASYSVSREDYMLPLLEFLWSQGVEAAAVQAHNSRNFAVVALQGFTREEINSKAHKQYEDALRAIGRKWKTESGGDDNLQGLYLQEYAGAAAKLSITKAN